MFHGLKHNSNAMGRVEMANKKGGSLETRLAAAEKHIRDLEESREALDAQMRKANLRARVEKLEKLTGQ